MYRDTVKVGFYGTQINETKEIKWFVTRTNHAKAMAIAEKLHGRRADVKAVQSKSRTLVKIYC